jgi:hypothetical protein
VLFAEEVNGFEGGFLNSVYYMVTHHINFDGLPLGAEGMLRNSHSDSTLTNTFFLVFHCIILWGFGIAERT